MFKHAKKWYTNTLATIRVKKVIYIFIISLLLYSCIKGELVDSSKSNSYFKKNNEIYYSQNGNWFELGYTKCNADSKTFRVISEKIAKDKNSVFLGYKIQTHIDYSTFRLDKNNIPKDKHYVYEIGSLNELKPIKTENIDVNSFEYIGKERYSKYGWAKDKSHYYFKQNIVPVDYSSLRFLTEDFFYDKDSLFTNLNNWKIKTIKSISNIPVKINEKYIIADKSIYFIGLNNSRKIELKTYYYTGRIDVINIITNNVLSLDNQILYYGEIFQNADAKTFQLISDSESGTHMKYYKDKNNVYLDKKVIKNANPNTFSKLEFGYSKDDKLVFYKTNTLVDANPKSFKKDKNTFMGWHDDEGNRYDNKGRKVKL